MDYSKKQNELDVQKWIDSESKNYDTCGEYCYCSNCNKSETYPCAYAYEKFTTLVTTISTPKKSKTIKTSCAKKTTTKKTTCAKKTTKSTTSTKKTTVKA